MAEAENKRVKLHNFFNQSNKRKLEEISKQEHEQEQDIELSLGLSLNGRFGNDPVRPDMVRSSSVSGFDFREGGGVTEVLERTRSMPEEMKWRRTEAKRKREGMMMMNVSEKQGRVVGGVMRQRHVAVVSQGSGSSGVSESEGQPMNQVANISVEDRSPGSVQSLSNQNETKQTAPVGGRKTDKPSMKLTNHDTKEMMKTMMGNVPCVSTRGVGSKRIEGFLYQYRKGEEVRIVCVCHGSFLTPAEFVKHAGGGDVSHPLKHIVVSPSPLL